MEWLNNWLKTVIIIILFASFIDLLLPSAKMHRYVKTVVSLFILLTLLTPVLQLLTKNWNVENLLNAAEKQQATAAMRMKQGNGAGGNVDSLEAILQQSDKLRAMNSAKAKQLAEQEMAVAIKQEVSREIAFDVDNVQVTATLDTNDKPNLQTIAIILKPLTITPSPTPGVATKKPIPSVKPVEIKVNIGKSSNGVQAVGAKERTPAMLEAERVVQQLLQRNWGVNNKQIEIIFLNQAEKS
ncbi:stage III sporulation protein AF [Paenibacillus sp. N1-5-1-14]|uniref:stage III sporulation protein AF n=1 Tax=Paenibacillus radicibacter TaxID=2972488 RepID=UPI002158E6A2|nr:stage III sporulation protein AF [Paenibacillus radicibacter]MCR8642419.1 stage III sporulation protein AF [Paenibacillus radicibacter]